MRSYRKTLLTCSLIISLVVYPIIALTATIESETEKEQISGEAMSVDLVAARPIGLAAMLGGTVVFLVSLPFSALGGNTAEAWNSLVASPAKYTFQRPLGNFDKQTISSDPKPVVN